eukprot:GILK01000828.1.p1 GENE.GILK01000828.1~~GILK01000828.1.p1  ORF type:complete len:122 (-),score=18.46 GILK01000828.1:285-608(-)
MAMYGHPPKQDMPPPGGFPKFELKPPVRTRGLFGKYTGLAMLLGSTLFMAQGWYRLGQSNIRRRKEVDIEVEERWKMIPDMLEANKLRKELIELELQERERAVGLRQ